MTYSDIQQYFLHSMVADQSKGIKGTDAAPRMAARVNQALGLVGLDNWQVVWGPGVFQHDPDGTLDNVAYLALDADRGVYCVAIAGTGFTSVFDLAEDMETSQTVPWPTDPNGGRVAKGSYLGLTKILGMVAAEGLAGAGQTLEQALTNAMAARDTPCTIVTTGHSLGGALAPLLALWLKDNQAAWDPGGRATDIGCWGYAGPTPGLSDFTAYYNARIPNSYRVHNTFDAVPYQWNAGDIAALPTLYVPPLSESVVVEIAAAVEKHMVKGLDYTQPGVHDMPLNGAYKELPGGPPKIAVEAFFEQASYQHFRGYFELLGLWEQFGKLKEFGA